jgi:hypothetical protein
MTPNEKASRYFSKGSLTNTKTTQHQNDTTPKTYKQSQLKTPGMVLASKEQEKQNH